MYNFMKHPMKKCFDTNNAEYLALFACTCNTHLSRATKPTCVDVQCPIRGLMPKLSRSPILFSHDDVHFAALIKRHQMLMRTEILMKFSFSVYGIDCSSAA